MADIHDIRVRIEGLVESSTTISAYAFDFISSLNSQHNPDEFPKLLQLPSTWRVSNLGSDSGEPEAHTMDLMLLDIYQDKEIKGKVETLKYQEMYKIMKPFVRSIPDGQNIQFINPRELNFEPTRFEGIDGLIVLRCRFSLQVHNCDV